MSPSIVEALRGVPLQPGQTYRGTVNGLTVEVRVLDDDAPTPELANQVMLQPWAEFPFTPQLTMRVKRGTLPLPDPPVIPPEEEEGTE